MQLSQRQMMIIGGAIIGIVILLLILGTGIRPDRSRSQEIVVWGLFEDPEMFEEIAKAHLQETGNKIIYIQKNPITYEQELLNALAGGSGPDVFFFKNSWLLRHNDKVETAPDNLFTAGEIEENYPQIVARDFISESEVFAVPMFLDTLALFYNQDLLDQAAVPFPPKTWEELVEITPRLTKTDASRGIVYSGVALGTPNNTDHAADILSLLMIQAGSEIVDNEFNVTFHRTKAGEESLGFYSQFAKPTSKSYTWNDNFDSSIEEFAMGKVAIIFGYASDIQKIKSISPYFNLKIALMPQSRSASIRKDYASYWGLAVNKHSQKSLAAWNLISYLSQNEQSRDFQRKTQLPPAKRLLLSEVKNQPLMDVFSKQAYTAVSWPQPETNVVESIFKRGITDALSDRKSLNNIVSDMANEIDELFKKSI